MGSHVVAWKRAFLFFALSFFLFFVVPMEATAHESWVLTPAQMAEWNTKPMPEIFTRFNATNISICVFMALFLTGWVLLDYTGARELFPDLQVRLASYGGYAAVALRVSLFILLGMAAFGLGPRHGTALYEAPTLGAPDLELRRLGPGTIGLKPGTFVLWMAVVETIAGVLVMAGVLMRPLSLVLFVAFVFFSAILGESVFGHIIFYGLLVCFITNSAGRWRRPVAEDKHGKIVILGGGLQRSIAP